MTDAEALQIKQNTERAISPGNNLVNENNGLNRDNDDKKTETIMMTEHIKKETMEVPINDLIKQTSNHDRIASQTLDGMDGINGMFAKNPLLWGYCELTRKQLDEDQAAFLTWTHPTDGFVHSWAIFDGHGGYETALYSAQHFLKYLQKYHLTRKNMQLSKWKNLMKEIFLKIDQDIGNLNIRGGSTVVVVLLIGNAIICSNAGDARAIMSRNNGKVVELSFDHTPMMIMIVWLKLENRRKIGKK